jgi:hypothetical protein
MKPLRLASSDIQRALQISNFLGVDLTNAKSEVALNRSPDALNLQINQGGNLEKRKGLKLVAPFTHPVVMIYTANVKTSSNTVIEILLCQSGGALLVYKTDGALIRPYETTSYEAIAGLTLSATLPVQIIPVDNNGLYYLLTGGKLTKPYLLKLDFANAQTGTASVIDLSNNTLANYDTFVNVPITHIGRNPLGTTTTEFEQRNVLSHYEENTFAGDDTAVYKPSGTLTSDVKVYVRSGSTWTLKTLTTHYTVNTGAGTITFTTGNIPTIPSDGADNVKIRFVSGAKSLEKIFSASTHGMYGFGGLRDYLFLSGYNTTTKSLIPMEHFGKRELPLQFGEFDTTTFPSKVLGYSHYGEYHIIYCEDFGNQPTVYRRSSALDAEGEVIFPLQSAVAGVGTLSGKSISNLKGEPIWLSEFGVNGFANRAEDRGYYINVDVLAQSNLSKAVGFVWNNLYHLCVGSSIYIADPRYIYSQRNAQAKAQYEWFKWELMNKLATINGQTEFGGRCYLATDNGIYVFKLSTDTNPYQDEISNYADDTDVAPDWDFDSVAYVENDIVKYNDLFYFCILAHTSDSGKNPTNETYWELYTTIQDGFAPNWASSTGYVFGNMVYYNNSYWVCKNKHTSTVSNYPVANSVFWVKASIYTQYFGSSFYRRIMIPVVAYWTTPVLQMGDISVRKSLKNVWVYLQKYALMAVTVYFSTEGTTPKYDEAFTFAYDFSRDNFTDDTDPLAIAVNRQARKFMSISLKIESADGNPFGLLTILMKYTANSQFKG